MKSIKKGKLGGFADVFHIKTPHNYHRLPIPSTQLFIVDPNSKISTNICGLTLCYRVKWDTQFHST